MFLKIEKKNHLIISQCIKMISVSILLAHNPPPPPHLPKICVRRLKELIQS